MHLFFVIMHNTCHFILDTTFGEFIHFPKNIKIGQNTKVRDAVQEKIIVPKNSIIKAG